MTKIKLPTHHRFINCTGKKFGRLTAVEYRGRKRRTSLWLCECTCGDRREYPLNNLRSGHTKSCGCLNSDLTALRNQTHGWRHTPTYNSWACMLSRCMNATAQDYPNYGGRGICVVDSWFDFENFLVDMGIKPPGMSLDRRDNDGDYGPDNCRWATLKEQARNKRTNRVLAAFGREQCLAAWAEEYEISDSVISRRIKRGWSVEEAIAVPRRVSLRLPGG